MPKDTNLKPLTIKDIREVLIPTMGKVFATKKDLERFAGKQDLEGVEQDLAALKDELLEFKDESLSKQDEILGKLETLLQEKQFDDHQTKRQRRLCRMMVDAARQGKPLSAKQLKEIKELGIL